jgi:hypothetical protein
MTENGIGVSVDDALAGQMCRLSSDGSVSCGWCLDSGKGVPVDVTVAAEFFKKTSDANDADGANSFGCGLERGDALMRIGKCRVHGESSPLSGLPSGNISNSPRELSPTLLSHS